MEVRSRSNENRYSGPGLAASQGIAHPPWCLIGRVLQNVQEVTVTLIALVWPSQPWYPTVLGLPVEPQGTSNILLSPTAAHICKTHTPPPQLATRMVSISASITIPLTNLTNKRKPDKLTWDAPCESGFQKLKGALPQEPILSVHLLRNYSTDISHCIGFTFSEFKDKECVAKVHIEWKDFSFHVDYIPLTSADDVLGEVSRAITESLKFDRITSGLECDRFFIALSNDELTLVSEHVLKRIQCQVRSRQSIVLQGTDHFWKYNPDGHERAKLHRYFLYRETLCLYIT